MRRPWESWDNGVERWTNGLSYVRCFRRHCDRPADHPHLVNFPRRERKDVDLGTAGRFHMKTAGLPSCRECRRGLTDVGPAVGCLIHLHHDVWKSMCNGGRMSAIGPDGRRWCVYPNAFRVVRVRAGGVLFWVTSESSAPLERRHTPAYTDPGYFTILEGAVPLRQERAA